MTEHTREKSGGEADGSGDPSAGAQDMESSSGLLRGLGDNVDRYLLWGALLLSGLLATIAAFNLYFQVGHVIRVWIAGRYQPIFQAGFNLVVLLVAGYVAVMVANRLEVG